MNNKTKYILIFLVICFLILFFTYDPNPYQGSGFGAPIMLQYDSIPLK